MAYYLVQKISTTIKTLIDDNGNILEPGVPEVTIVSENIIPVQKQTSVIHKISGSEKQFGFIAGKDLKILELFPLGHDVTVEIYSSDIAPYCVETHLHRQMKRRVDGLTKAYKDTEIMDGTELEVTVNTEKNLIRLKKLD